MMWILRLVQTEDQAGLEDLPDFPIDFSFGLFHTAACYKIHHLSKVMHERLRGRLRDLGVSTTSTDSCWLEWKQWIKKLWLSESEPLLRPDETMTGILCVRL